MAALGVDDDRLVRVAAQRLDRLRVAVGPAVVRVDLEDVAVVLQEAVLAGLVLGLLAGQPGAPRGAAMRRSWWRSPATPTHSTTWPPCWATSTMVTPPAGAGVVDQALGQRDRVRPVGAGTGQLVVGGEQRGTAQALEGGGAVMVGGGRLAGLQLGDAGPGDDAVREALGQREDALGVGDQLAVAEPAVVPGRAGRRGGRRGVRGEGAGCGREDVDGSGQRDSGAGDRRALGEVSAGERHRSLLGPQGHCSGAVTLPPHDERELN